MWSKTACWIRIVYGIKVRRLPPEKSGGSLRTAAVMKYVAKSTRRRRRISQARFFFMVKTVMGWQENPHKMRSAQTPFGAWAIMKKFILYALLSGSLISSLTVFKVYQPIMNKLWTWCENLVNFTKKYRNQKRNCTNCIKMRKPWKHSIHGVLVVTGE